MGELTNTRRRLWDLNKCCFWCGKDTVWFGNLLGERPPDLGATLDHVYRISDPRRQIVPNAVLLACNKCNFERGKAQDNIARKFEPFTEKSIERILSEKQYLIPIEREEVADGEKAVVLEPKVTYRKFLFRMFFGLIHLSLIEKEQYEIRSSKES